MEEIVIYEKGMDVKEVAESMACCSGRPSTPSDAEE